MLNPTRLTLILGSIVLALGGYILLVDIPKTREFKKQETQEKQLLPFDDREVTEITWESRTETIHLSRDDRYRWEVMEPLRTHGDSREVRRILRALTIGKIKRTIEDGKENLSQYGLDPPYLTLTLKTPTTTHQISLGDPGPFAPSLYVKTKTDDQVVLTTLDVATFAKRTLTSFRLKDLLLFDRENVLQLQITRNQNPVVLTRVAGAHSLTPNWKMAQPMVGAADKTVVGTLLMDLSDLSATGFVDDPEEQRQILQQTPAKQAEVRLTVGRRTHQAQLYQYADPDKAYARTSEKGPLYEIKPSILTLVTQPVFYFQNKRFFGMELKELAMVEIHTPEEHYVLVKQHDQWRLNSDPSAELNQELVILFLSRVVDLPAEIYLPDTIQASSDNGLLPPNITIRGRDKNGTERGRLELGKREKGLVYAQGAQLAGVYQARSNILNQIPSRAKLIRKGSGI